MTVEEHVVLEKQEQERIVGWRTGRRRLRARRALGQWGKSQRQTSLIVDPRTAHRR